MCHCVDFCFNATFPFLLFIPCELLRCVLTRFLLFEDWDHHKASGGSTDCKIYLVATRLTGRHLHNYLATRCIYAYMRTRGLLFDKDWVKVTFSASIHVTNQGLYVATKIYLLHASNMCLQFSLQCPKDSPAKQLQERH